MACQINRAVVVISLLLISLSAFATIFGAVSGLIHDPQHRPVQGAQVTLRAASSSWTKTVTSTDAGEFHFDNVPMGEYKVAVDTPGFAARRTEADSNSAATPACIFHSALPPTRKRSKSPTRLAP